MQKNMEKCRYSCPCTEVTPALYELIICDSLLGNDTEDLVDGGIEEW